MDHEDRITSEEWRRMRGSSWAAIVLAILGFAAAAGFAIMYFLNYAKAEFSKKEAERAAQELEEETSKRDERIMSLEEELNDKRKKFESLESKNRDLEFRLQGKEELAEKLSDEIDEKDKQIKSLEEGSEAILKLRLELADKKDRLDKAQRERDEIRSSLGQVQAELTARKTENETLEKELERARVDLTEARRKVEESTLARATKDVLQVQLRERVKQVEELKEMIKGMEDTLLQKQVEINKLRETVGKAGRETEELQETKEDLAKRMQEIGRMGAEMDNLEAQIDRLKAQVTNDKKTMEDLQNALAAEGKESEQVEILRHALAERDETISKKDDKIAEIKKEKDEKITGLKSEIARVEERLKDQAALGDTNIEVLRAELKEKTGLLTALEKDNEELKASKSELSGRLKSEEYASELMEKGEDIEQVKVRTGFWHASNIMAVRASKDSALPGTKINLGTDLGLEMVRDAVVIDMHFSARFGFSLNYEELTFSGRGVMPGDENFYGKTFEAGNPVDSEFYISRTSLNLHFNLGALLKRPHRRIDLALVVAGNYLKVNARMLELIPGGDRASHSLSALIMTPGLKMTCRYRDGITLLAHLSAMSYRFGKHRLRNMVGMKLSMDFRISESFDIEFGYAYSNINYSEDDTNTGEKFQIKLASEGPYVSFVLTF